MKIAANKTEIAEWLLSVVLPPDRAISTVGDWMEDIESRGGVWFWSCVLRTVLSCVWRDVVESPGFLFGLGLRSVLYGFSVALSTGALFLIVAAIAAVCIGLPAGILMNFLAPGFHWPSWNFTPARDVLIRAIVLAWTAWCQFQVGRWIARKAPGREIAACISALLAPVFLTFVAGIVITTFRDAEVSRFVAGHPDPTSIFLFAGALAGRRKYLKGVVG